MDNYMELSTYLQPDVVELKKPTPLRPTPGIPFPIMPMTPPPPAPISDLESELLDQLITKQINDNLALSYIRSIETTFKYNNPQIYNEFIDSMKLYKFKKITFECLRDKISWLFNNHPDLIIGFNTFLPEPYKISMENRKIQDYQLLPSAESIAPGLHSGMLFDHHLNNYSGVPSMSYLSPNNNYDYKKLNIQQHNSIVQSRFHPYVYTHDNINSAFIDPRYETISPDQSSSHGRSGSGRDDGGRVAYSGGKLSSLTGVAVVAGGGYLMGRHSGGMNYGGGDCGGGGDYGSGDCGGGGDCGGVIALSVLCACMDTETSTINLDSYGYCIICCCESLAECCVNSRDCSGCGDSGSC
ncbi:hypothetical protein HCN44_006815 [Aphidius gifuensis]|uniref:Uncharacterized protein n=1 Tax=Aphidius gifuensis TaxID=684658 RepID=A0A834Y0Z5_APHGI|nr:hypothetical protein HCN44_006815 [Aphidius gifuensis]